MSCFFVLTWIISLHFLHVIFIVGYWPSYNIPFYPVIYNLTGYADYEEQYPNFASYEVSARAKIFRRDQGNIVDMESMQAFMRSNGIYLVSYILSNFFKPTCIRSSWYSFRLLTYVLYSVNLICYLHCLIYVGYCQCTNVPCVRFQCTVWVKNIPLRFSDIFTIRLGIFSPNFTRLLYTFLSTLDYIFLFNYLQLWRSYATLSATTQFTSCSNHRPKRTLGCRT